MMLPAHLWLLFLLPMGRGDQKKPKFLSFPQKPTTAYTGTNISLEWRYFISSGYAVKEISFGIWGSPGYLTKKLINITPGRSPEVRQGFEEKVTWSGNLSSSRAAFVLNSVNKQDESYGIHIELGLQYNALTDWLNLLVQETEPARIAFISSNVSMVLGETLNITCKATGMPEPIVLWRRDNMTLSTGSRRIQFVKDGFTTRDAGVYTCVSNNNDNISDQKDVFVNLKPPGLTSGSYSKTMNALTVVVTGLVCAYKIMYR